MEDGVMPRENIIKETRCENDIKELSWKLSDKTMAS
jgi:hypothetical protein